MLKHSHIAQRVVQHIFVYFFVRERNKEEGVRYDPGEESPKGDQKKGSATVSVAVGSDKLTAQREGVTEHFV